MNYLNTCMQRTPQVVIRLLIALIIVYGPADLCTARTGVEPFEGRIIDEVRIIGAKHTKEYVIRRELVSLPGEMLRVEDVKVDERKLDRLGIFSEIKVYPIEEEGRVILIVEVKETFRFLPVVALKIDDENGISIGGGAKSVNLFGRAIFASSTVLFGGALTIDARITDHWFAGNHLGYDVQYYHRDRRNELHEFNEIADELYLTFQGFIGENGRYGIRTANLYIQSDEDGRTLDPDNRDNAFSLGFFLGYDTRDLWSNPHTGWWNEIDINRVWMLGVEQVFWRGNIDIRRYIQINDPHILAIFSLTTLTSGTVGENIAVWQEFALGGTNSIRGWDIGRRYGKNQFINTLEYRYNILEPRNFSYFGLNVPLGVQLALFGDLGVVWSDPGEYTHSFIGGGGFGIRLIIPYVGLARLDFGWGEVGAGIQIHLGSKDKPVRQRDRVR